MNRNLPRPNAQSVLEKGFKFSSVGFNFLKQILKYIASYSNAETFNRTTSCFENVKPVLENFQIKFELRNLCLKLAHNESFFYHELKPPNEGSLYLKS